MCPRADLEMLFPNARVRMRATDKLLIGVPAVVSADHHGDHEARRGPVAGAVVAGVLVRAAQRAGPARPGPASSPSVRAWRPSAASWWRQFGKYKNRKIQFMKSLSENLYFRNLDNDAGVFNHLLDAAEEEEVKEAVLAYHFLRKCRESTHRRRTGPAYRDLVHAAMGCTEFDFEVADGVGKLRRLRLLDDTGRRLSAVPLEEACRRLDETWDNLFVYNSSPRSAEV